MGATRGDLVIVRARRWWRLKRWQHDTSTLPPGLQRLANHRREIIALLALALFGFVCSALATAVAVADRQAFSGWALLVLLAVAALAASAAGHLLVDLAGLAAVRIVRMMRRPA